MISKALLVLFFATVYQCYFFLGLCQSTVSENSQCLNRRDDCYKDNSCSYTFTLPRSDGENCPALRDTLMDLQRVKTRLEEQQLRLDEQEIHLEEQQLRLDGQERLLEEQQRLINKLEEKTYDYMCSTIDGISLKFENYLNLTTGTSDITETSKILSFDSFTLNHTYLLVVTLKELYVYQVFGGGVLQKVQNISSVGSYGHWNSMSGTGSFELNGQYFFILNSYGPHSLGVYRWDGTQLVEDDIISSRYPIYDGLKWSFFESTFYNENFLANAFVSVGDVVETEPSLVYKLNGSQFVYLQEIDTLKNTLDVSVF
ncbi:uncharacterized protein [Ptychodera flava]|uniref:uncharacterized protein isoform X2 n=1 Tax=Ptychodera flava TaxID=63121 RepID=UPI003969F1B7